MTESGSNVTESAADCIRDMLDKDGKADTHGLRMKVVGGGCSGLQYELSFDDQIGDYDTEINEGGVRVIVDQKSALYLAGSDRAWRKQHHRHLAAVPGLREQFTRGDCIHSDARLAPRIRSVQRVHPITP